MGRGHRWTMPGNCRSPCPSLAPVLLAVLLGGEWGPRPPSCPPVPHPHCPDGRVRQDQAQDRSLKGRVGGKERDGSVSPSVKWAKPSPSCPGRYPGDSV